MMCFFLAHCARGTRDAGKGSPILYRYTAIHECFVKIPIILSELQL